MKSLLSRLLIVTAVSVLLTSCLKDKITKTYAIYTPVYKTKAEVFSALKAGTPAAVSSPGKIFLYGNYIFLNEVDKGVHIIDNSNPSAPVNKYFIPVPGNLDMAVKGNMLYVDMYADLLAIDISDPANIKLKDTISGLFPERIYAGGFVPETGKVIVDWIRKDTTVEVKNTPWFPCMTCNFMFATAQDASGGTKASVPGIAGSMARFSIVNNVLYALNATHLNTISLADPANPEPAHSLEMNNQIETIYPFKDKLFIGSATGMLICNIADPLTPTVEGSFIHARACDPVIVDDRYAYITLRTGVFCGGTQNQLDVVDVASVANPKLARTYGMVNPHGLAKYGKTLFICDGNAGLKIYDATDPYALKLEQELTGMDTYDAIAYNKILMLVTREGLKQYDYTDLKNIRLLSTIGLKK